MADPIFYVDGRYGLSNSTKEWNNMGTATMNTTTAQVPNSSVYPDRGFINNALVDLNGATNFIWDSLPALDDFTLEFNCKLGSKGSAAGILLDASSSAFDIYQKNNDTIYEIWVAGKQYNLSRTVNDKDCIQIRRQS